VRGNTFTHARRHPIIDSRAPTHCKREMNVKLIQPRQPRPAEARMLMHPQYPIAQAFASGDSLIQQQLMQEAWHGIAEPEQALIVADCNGLRVLARSEPALDRVAKTLRGRFGSALVAGAPEVRYGLGSPMLEPYMIVLVHAPARHLARVRGDFVGRRGRIERIAERSTFVLEGEAPLAELLGYHGHVRDMLGQDWSRSHVSTWLSRYVAIGGEGPEAA